MQKSYFPCMYILINDLYIFVRCFVIFSLIFFLIVSNQFWNHGVLVQFLTYLQVALSFQYPLGINKGDNHPQIFNYLIHCIRKEFNFSLCGVVNPIPLQSKSIFIETSIIPYPQNYSLIISFIRSIFHWVNWRGEKI